MEKKLKLLFDYQRFENNGKLEKIIAETESRYGGELADDDLLLVNAAGDGWPESPDGNFNRTIGSGGGEGAGGNGAALSN